MSYSLRNYRHRNPKGGDDKKSSAPFFQAPQKAVSRKKKQAGFFQPKLAVGQPGDSFEKEADATASEVTKPESAKASAETGIQQKEMPGVQRLATSKEDEKLGTNDARMEKDKEEPMKPVQKKGAPEKDKEQPVQKAEDPKKEKKDKPVQKKGAGEEKKKKKGAQKMADPKKEKPVNKAEDPKKEKPINKVEDPKKEKKLQKAEDPKKEKKDKPVQKKEAPGGHESMTSEAVAAEIKKQSGKGSPLPPKVLAEMSKSFGVDLSNVRIHSDMAAVKLCQELHAMAFTHGQDIYFNEGKFNPESAEGKMLLAHELTHVIQQANSIES